MTPGRYSVARDAAITALGRGTGMFVSLLAGIAVARVWGPEGKGIVSFLSAGAALAARLGALGIEAGVGHFLLVRRRDHGRCLGTIFASASGAGAAVALVGACVLLWRPGSIGSVPAEAVLAQLAALPASFVLFVGAYVFFAFGKALSFSVFDASYRATLLAAVGIAALAATTVTTLVILQAATLLAPCVNRSDLAWQTSRNPKAPNHRLNHLRRLRNLLLRTRRRSRHPRWRQPRGRAISPNC